MKRILFLLAGLLFLALPAMGTAAAPPTVSAYAETVLERAEQGIEYAWSGDAPLSFFVGDTLPWAENVFTTVAGLLQNKVDVTQQVASLTDVTACEQSDRIAILEEMNRVQSEMERALDEQNGTAILRLKDLLSFLQERLAVIQQGARDPAFTDDTWSDERLFDDPDTFEPETEPLCPFSSNYLPPSVSGFGCDASVLQTVSDSLPPPDQLPFSASVRAELEGERAIEKAVTDYQDQIRALAEAGKQISTFFMGDASAQPTAPSATRTHVTQNGCVVGGRCDGNLTQACQTDFDCGLITGRCIDARQVGTCSDDNGKLCTSKDQCGTNAVCQTLQTATFYTVGTPFSLSNQMRALQYYQTIQQQQALQRPTSSLFQKTSEGIIGFLQEFFGGGIQKFSVSQSQSDVRTFAIGSDPVLSLQGNYATLQSSISDLGELGSGHASGDKQTLIGLRGFVRDFASFLRRTCIDRPCNVNLDNILRIVFQDECFPYTSGTYMGDGPDRDRAAACKKAAGIGTVLQSF